jgi:hypothetical protein
MVPVPVRDPLLGEGGISRIAASKHADNERAGSSAAMQTAPSREHAAAALYASLAVLALAAAYLTLNILLVGVAVVMVVAALASVRGYPIDRYW